MGREKVIKALEHCGSGQSEFGGCNGCPYKDEFHRSVEECLWCRIDDAIALLKEHEAKSVESIQMDRSDKWGADLTGYCPSCKRPLKSRFNTRFCGECGQEVKWDE